MASWASGAVNELIAATGGDYTTLAAFEGAHDGETPTNGTTCKARIKGVPADGSIVYWDGWQSGQNSTTKVVIVAETGSETDGTNGSGDDAKITSRHYIYQATNPLIIDFIGIEFNNSTNYAINFLSSVTTSVLTVAKCFFRNSTLTGISHDIGSAANNSYVGGCLFKDCGTNAYQGGARTNDTDAIMTIYNCTSVGGRHGVANFAGSLTVKNTACANTTTSDFEGTITQSYNASEDTTASGTGSVTTLTITDADDFTAPSTGDYTVYNTSSVLYEKGNTISASWFTTLCATDLKGTTWRATPAIGCYELVTGGGGTLTINVADCFEQEECLI